MTLLIAVACLLAGEWFDTPGNDDLSWGLGLMLTWAGIGLLLRWVRQAPVEEEPNEPSRG